MKNYAIFDADFADDSEWTEDGDLLLPQGQAVADFLASALSLQGFKCSSPNQHSFFGWIFEVTLEQFHFNCILQFIEPWLLICNIRVSLKDKLLGRKHRAEHQVIIDALDSVLQQDARFDAVEWFTREEYESTDHSPPPSRGGSGQNT